MFLYTVIRLILSNPHDLKLCSIKEPVSLVDLKGRFSLVLGLMGVRWYVKIEDQG